MKSLNLNIIPTSVGSSVAAFKFLKTDFYNFLDFNVLLLADTKEYFFNTLIKIGKFFIPHSLLILFLALVVYMIWLFNKFKEKIGNYIFKSAMALEADRLDEVWSVGISDNIEQIELLNIKIKEAEKNVITNNQDILSEQVTTLKYDIKRKEAETKKFTEAIGILRKI